MSHEALGMQFHPYKNAAHKQLAEVDPQGLARYRAASQRLGPAQHWPKPGENEEFDRKATAMHEAAEHLEERTGIHPMDWDI